jgi:arylsulfatase
MVKLKIYLWRSPDLANWEGFSMQYMMEESFWKQKHPEVYEKGIPKEWFVWTPKMYCEDGNWIFVHTSPSPYRNIAELNVSKGLINLSEYSLPMGDDMFNKQDPSLFHDDDGQWYLIYANTFIAPIKRGFAGLAATPKRIGPSDMTISYEGATIRKIGKKYVLFGTVWLTDKGQKGANELIYCTADQIDGPYSERRIAGKFPVHGTPFQDKEERWWCTAFFNGQTPKSDRTDIHQQDWNETTPTINEQGTSIVPLDVQTLENGDVYIHAKDPRYAVYE